MQVLGSIMYVVVCLRLDLAYAVNLVNRFMANPRKEHWHALKWILRYVKGTLNVGLVFWKTEDKSEIMKGFVIQTL